MADTSKPPMGKQFQGQATTAVKTAQDVQDVIDAQKPFDKPDAISFDTYCAMRQIRDPVAKAAMAAYTSVRKATMADWVEIFAAF